MNLKLQKQGNPISIYVNKNSQFIYFQIYESGFKDLVYLCPKWSNIILYGNRYVADLAFKWEE